ncbi:hypothetical protein SAMN04489867_1574 [Pedococcus dokdonensis]|uniref:Tissue inhibitor of metalloproteinase n=1 Tax=Pedococcus dokdonensis TaxID=443156 RepID=A0A1H0QG01_9MICO|nr:hypothetical protein [Pedococcus dokdonensis]SDP15659.1 hypothetical protein SAMN04489867_1574 [Pedococcus dokdonensis]
MRPSGVKRALLLVPVVFAALVVLPSSPAWACSCASATTAEYADRSDVVLRGALEKVDRPAGLQDPSTGSPARSYRFAVTGVYRGSAAPTTWVSSSGDGGSCGLEGMEPGREYVVFAQERGDGLWASLCGGTGPAEPLLVAQVEAVAGAGHAPAPAATVAPHGATPVARPAGSVAPPIGAGDGWSRCSAARPWPSRSPRPWSWSSAGAAAGPRRRHAPDLGVLSALSGQARRTGDSAVSMERRRCPAL